jgi:hypothetical protein
MKAHLPRLLSFVGASLLGGAVTFALLPRETPSPQIPASTAEVVSASEDPPANELAARILEAYHGTVVSEFVHRSGFGISRTAPHPGFSPYPNSVFTRFEFTFIGNDPLERKFEVTDPSLVGRPLVFHLNEAYARREEARNALMLQNVDPFQRAPVYDPRALFDKDLKPEVSLPTETEFAILARFEASPEKTIELHPVAGGTLGYGALRASASCLECHEKKEGDLLGLFRYRIEHGPAGSLKDLALK